MKRPTVEMVEAITKKIQDMVVATEVYGDEPAPPADPSQWILTLQLALQNANVESKLAKHQPNRVDNYVHYLEILGVAVVMALLDHTCSQTDKQKEETDANTSSLRRLPLGHKLHRG